MVNGVPKGARSVVCLSQNESTAVQAENIDKKNDELRKQASALEMARRTMSNQREVLHSKAKAITQIFPELKGLLDGRAVRTPMTVGGSIVDAVFEMKGEVTVEQINALMQQSSHNGELVGILGYEDRPLVSTDYNNDSRSGIVDGGSTMVINKTMLKMYVWYDNEWGYSCRMWDLIQMVVKGGSV